MYTYTCSSKCRDVGQEKETHENGTAMNSICQENLSA
jgi:hypothetical protein